MKYEYKILFDSDSEELAASIAEVIALNILDTPVRRLGHDLTITLPILHSVLVKPEEE